MLANTVVSANVPVTDVARARRFYGETLGLAEAGWGEPDEAFFRAAGETMLHLVEEPSPTPSGHTVVTFYVTDLTAEMAHLRARGVAFEDVDTPHLRTRDGVYDHPSGFRAAWLRDPDGNVVALEQLAEVWSEAS